MPLYIKLNIAFGSGILVPSNPIETNPNLAACSTLGISNSKNNLISINITPNPTSGTLFIKTMYPEVSSVKIYSMSGQFLKKLKII